MSFWSPGFWAAGFWSSGFWGEEVVEQPTTGGSARRKPRGINKPVIFQPALDARRREEAALLLSGII